MTDIDVRADVELRARLGDYVENALDPQAAAAACLAVLDLHRPFVKAGMVLCEECSPANGSDANGTILRRHVLSSWPCPTWKAVAGPFGIEAPEVNDD